jgi:hypothetical protein
MFPVENKRLLRLTLRGTNDDSHGEICTDKLVVSGKKTQDSFNRPYRFQYVDISGKNAMETCSHSLVVSKILLVYDEQARKMPWFWLFHMALA